MIPIFLLGNYAKFVPLLLFWGVLVFCGPSTDVSFSFFWSAGLEQQLEESLLPPFYRQQRGSSPFNRGSRSLLHRTHVDFSSFREALARMNDLSLLFFPFVFFFLKGKRVLGTCSSFFLL